MGFLPDAMKRFNPSMLGSLASLGWMNKVRLEGDRIIKADPDMFNDVNAMFRLYC